MKKAREKEIHIIHQNLVALKKKLEVRNEIEGYIQCLMQIESFGEVDNLMETLISDLLYRGYSLRYISGYFKDQQKYFLETKDLDAVLEKLKDLDKKTGDD